MQHNHSLITNEPAFQFTSAFKYSALPSYDGTDGIDDRDYDKKKRMIGASFFVHYGIVIVFYLLLFITFPISVWFCIKKVNSLQRCVIFRLGQRMPLKGPGLVITFPWIDAFEIVDLSDHEMTIVDREQELLMSDGSIVQFPSLTGILNVTNAVRSSTQLKDAKFNAQQFVKLSFINMIGSTHVEDLEKKTDVIMRRFEENCNIYLNNWGWDIKVDHYPKFIILNRADPLSPIVSKIKGLFTPNAAPCSSGSASTDSLFAKLLSLNSANNCNSSSAALSAKSAPNSSQSINNDLSDSGLLSSALQSMANKLSDKYSGFITCDMFIKIEIKDISWIDYFRFNYKTGEVQKILDKPEKVNINVCAKTSEDLMDFCRNEDTSKVNITTNLL